MFDAYEEVLLEFGLSKVHKVKASNFSHLMRKSTADILTHARFIVHVYAISTIDFFSLAVEINYFTLYSELLTSEDSDPSFCTFR